MKINKVAFIIGMIFLMLGITSFSMFFIVRDKYEGKTNSINKNNSEMVGDIVFTYIDDSIYIKDMIPTLDKFGIMNEPFTFAIKNNSSDVKKYTLSLLDDNSTIKNSDIRYELAKNNQVMGIYTLSSSGIIDISEINGKEEVKYTIKLWLNYNSEYLVGTFKKKISVSLNDEEKENVNQPILVDGMIPVYYNYENNSWYKADTNNNYNNEWYNYSMQKWANAVTVNEDKRKYYAESMVGTKINLEDVNAFWVWVPRFNYELENNNIKIHFVNEETESYRAFNFNNQELTGFWVSKYESALKDNSICIESSLTKNCNTQNNKLYFVPNYSFTNRITMANLFYSIRKMELSGNIYGFKGAGNKLNSDGTIKNDANDIDIHMIRNSEWQAIALLSDSIYGKFGNSNYSDEDKLIYNNNSTYTGKSFYQNTLYEYNILLKGEGASTTGNTTGIFDMAGGKREYVMINNSKLDIFNKNSNSGFTSKIKECYYDDDFLSDTTLQFQERYSQDNNITNNPITRGGYKNTGNIFNVYSANDFVNKVSLESNSRAIIMIVKEK